VLTSDIEEATRAVANIGKVNRAGCRQRFEERFTSDVMSAQYLRMYQALLRQEGQAIPASNGVRIV